MRDTKTIKHGIIENKIRNKEVILAFLSQRTLYKSNESKFCQLYSLSFLCRNQYKKDVIIGLSLAINALT